MDGENSFLDVEDLFDYKSLIDKRERIQYAIDDLKELIDSLRETKKSFPRDEDWEEGITN